MTHKTIIPVLIALAAGSASAAPWWDDFPRMVDTWSPDIVSDYHGSFAMNGIGNDPAWGTFFQANELRGKSGSIAAFQNAGYKQIYYTETYGTTASLVAEIGTRFLNNPTPVLHTHWSWPGYNGGTIQWLGAKDFFDDEEFARPYTRTHSRYGGPAMTYPDGAEATGYDGDATDPRNSRVYDASCAKDLHGELFVTTFETTGPTNGLFYVQELNEGAGGYCGFLDFGKDTACPFWTNYTYASTLQAADAGVDGM